jgi:HAD superfamily hydrolase (TIGR01509 family)
VCGLGNAKDAEVNRVLAADGVQAYPGSVAFLDALAARGMPVAVVSSSRNTRAVLHAAGLDDRFTVIVDGVRAAAEGLAGKPRPDTYVRAALDLGVPVRSAVIIEDAVSGVAAGRAGAFGLVVGVDRGVGAGALRAAGADLVVADLCELVGPAPAALG